MLRNIPLLRGIPSQTAGNCLPRRLRFGTLARHTGFRLVMWISCKRVIGTNLCKGEEHSRVRTDICKASNVHGTVTHRIGSTRHAIHNVTNEHEHKGETETSGNVARQHCPGAGGLAILLRSTLLGHQSRWNSSQISSVRHIAPIATVSCVHSSPVGVVERAGRFRLCTKRWFSQDTESHATRNVHNSSGCNSSQHAHKFPQIVN